MPSFGVCEVALSPAPNPSAGNIPITIWRRDAADPDVEGSYSLRTSSYYIDAGSLSGGFYSVEGPGSGYCYKEDATDGLVDGHSYVYRIQLNCNPGVYHYTDPIAWSPGGTTTTTTTTSSGLTSVFVNNLAATDIEILDIIVNGVSMTPATPYPIQAGENNSGSVTSGTWTVSISCELSALPQKLTIVDSNGTTHCQDLDESDTFNFPGVVFGANPVDIIGSSGSC